MSLRVICLGLGGRGRHWVRTVQESRGAELAGIVDPDDARRSQHGDELGVPPAERFTSIAAAIEATRPDAAVIVTPNVLHEAHIMECLGAKLHVLCEKPLVMDGDAARRVIRAAKERGRVLDVVQNYRWHPLMLTARRLLADGAIGEPTSCVIDFHLLRPIHGMPYPLLYNQAIHHLDAVRWVFGCDADWVSAVSWNPPWHDCDGDTMIEATYRLANGVIFHYSGNYTTHGKCTPYSGVWRIEGSDASLHLADFEDAPLLRLERGREAVETPPLTTDALGANGRLLANFAHAIETGEPSPTDAGDNVKSLAMVWAAIAAAASGGRVAVEEFAVP